MAKTSCSTIVKAAPVEFRFFNPMAKRVSLAGDFNNWDTNKLLAKKDVKGNWIIKASLKPGKYEYKFFVDGSWVNDPNSTSVDNLFGTQNSVIEIK